MQHLSKYLFTLFAILVVSISSYGRCPCPSEQIVYSYTDPATGEVVDIKNTIISTGQDATSLLDIAETLTPNTEFQLYVYENDTNPDISKFEELLQKKNITLSSVSYTHLRAHETLR